MGSVWQRLFGPLTRTRRARRWAEGLHVRTDDRGAAWDAPARAEFRRESTQI